MSLPSLPENRTQYASLEAYYKHQAEHGFRSVIFWTPGKPTSSPQLTERLALQHIPIVDSKSNFRRFLGTEQPALYFKFDHNWNANAWAACTGTAIAGGIVMVEITEALKQSAAWKHLTSFWQVDDVYECHCDNELTNFLKNWQPPITQSEFIATPTQKRLIEDLTQRVLENPQGVSLIYAARGRGKTATIAAWCRTLPSEQRVYISAPSKAQATAILDSCEHLECHFLAPEEVATYQESATSHDILIVDEAATLPFIGQRALLKHPGYLILATTTEGYEFAGRGFQLKFEHMLKSSFTHFHSDWLHQPIRWSDNDPLERATHEAFSLKSDWNNTEQFNQNLSVGLPSNIEYQACRATELSPERRIDCFSLLVDAHYQTTPNDFKLLLDDPSQWLMLQKAGETIVGVAWLNEEGPLINDLITPITQGKRRPQGNLLPQTFCYYLKRPVLGTFRHIRVVRIAVLPQYRRKGFGQGLLARIEYWSKERGAESVGTSFGATQELMTFWQQNGFIPVRLGQKVDPASGKASVVFVYPLTKRMQIYVRELSSLFATELNARLLAHVTEPNDASMSRSPKDAIQFLYDAIPFNERPEASQIRRWQELGRAFVKGELNFYDYAPWLLASLAYSWVRVDDEAHDLLTRLALSSDSKQIASILCADGKAQGLEKLRQLCEPFHHADV